MEIQILSENVKLYQIGFTVTDIVVFSLAEPGFGQGGSRNFVRDFVDVAKQSWVSKVSQYKQGSGSSCIFNCQICILPLLLVLFLQTFTVVLCG